MKEVSVLEMTTTKATKKITMITLMTINHVAKMTTMRNPSNTQTIIVVNHVMHHISLMTHFVLIVSLMTNGALMTCNGSQ